MLWGSGRSSGPELDAAVREWAGLAFWIARDFSFPGAERDDVNQEALIGLWTGLRSHDSARVPLKPWLSIVVRKHLASRLKDHRRFKHQVLSEASSLTEPDQGAGHSAHPGETVSASGSVSDVLAPLSLAERRAVVGVTCGLEYSELGDVKAVDNALQRARRKLRAAA